MNKRFLQFMACALMMVGTVGSVQAQDYAYFTDFSMGIPDDMVLYDVDGLTPTSGLEFFDAAWIPLTFNDVNLPSFPVASSTSWFTSPDTADDWMVLPGIDISLGQKLVWKAAATNPGFADGYEIVVSTVSNGLTDMQAGTVIYSVDEEESIDLDGEEDQFLFEREVSLDEWDGETIYIGFRNNSFDKQFLFIDDIGVLEAPEGIDAAIADLSIPIEYGWMPIFQATPIGPFEASIFSFSNADITDARIIVHIDSVDVDGNFVPVWSAESNQTDLMPLATDVYEIDETWLPEEPALYVLYYEIVHNDTPTDLNSDNDFSEAYYFFVTELDYSRNAFYILNGDPPLVSDFQSFFFTPDPTDDQGNTTDPTPTGEYGQVLEFTNYSRVDSIGMQIQDAAGDIVVNVYEFNSTNNTVGDLVGSTVPFTDGTDGNSYVIAQMDPPLDLAPGDYLVAIADPDNGSAKVIACNYYRTPDKCFSREDGGDWEEFNWVPIVETYLSEIEFATTATFDFVPNNLGVDFSATTDGFIETWEWDFGDGTTSTEQSPSHVYAMAGTYTVILTATTPDGTQITETAEVTVSCLFAVEIGDITPTGATVEFTVEGIPPYTYAWQNAAGETVATTTEPTIDSLELETAYTVIVESADGCSTTVDFTTAGCNLSLGAPIVAEQTVLFSSSDIISGEPSIYDWPQAILDAAPGNVTNSQIVENVPLDSYTMTIFDDFGCSTEVSFTVDEITGIEDITIINEMEIYPNPATNVLMVELDLKEASDVQIGLYDVTGKLVVENKVSNVVTLAQPMDVTELANGIYLVRVTLGSDTITYRVVIGK